MRKGTGSMTVRSVRHFQEITDRAGADLSWYLIYRAIAYAQEALHVPFDEVDESDLKCSIFMYLMKHELNKMISDHIFGEKSMLTEKAFEEAKEYFVLEHKCTTFLLSTYLNYLDEWSSSCRNWTRNHPLPLSCMTVCRTD